MILYRIDYCYPHEEGGRQPKFILAQNESIAITKYSKLVVLPKTKHFVGITEICKRDEIIPTVEPTKEFTHG